jgi:hypothetical protein
MCLECASEASVPELQSHDLPAGVTTQISIKELVRSRCNTEGRAGGNLCLKFSTKRNNTSIMRQLGKENPLRTEIKEQIMLVILWHG